MLRNAASDLQRIASLRLRITVDRELLKYANIAGFLNQNGTA